jgi:hypothetical protein
MTTPIANNSLPSSFMQRTTFAYRPGHPEGPGEFPDRRQGEPLVTPGLEIAQAGGFGFQADGATRNRGI